MFSAVCVGVLVHCFVCVGVVATKDKRQKLYCCLPLLQDTDHESDFWKFLFFQVNHSSVNHILYTGSITTQCLGY
jgi:hypothetical protein